MNIQIDKANANDIEILTDLFMEFDLYNNEVGNKSLTPREENRSYAEYDILNSGREVYIARVDGKAVGYITYFLINVSNELFIEDIFISKSARNLGLGKLLMQIPMNLAKEKKLLLKLEVYKWNDDAINFYKNLRFEEDSIVFIKKFD